MFTLIVDGDPVLFRSAWNCNTLEQALAEYRKNIEDLENCCFNNLRETKVAVKGNGNFRIDFCSNYKSGRSRAQAKNDNPMDVELRNYLISKGEVIPADGMEADDLVRIWAVEAQKKGHKYIIASLDKDLQCIPGIHYTWRFINKQMFDSFHHVDEDTADIHYWSQVLQGDPVDDIPGIWRVGPVKAKNILEGASGSLERKQRVIDAYYEAYGDDWKEKMMHTGTLIHIMRTPNDMFKLREDDCPTELKDE